LLDTTIKNNSHGIFKHVSLTLLILLLAVFNTRALAAGNTKPSDADAMLRDIAVSKICAQLNNRFREIQGVDMQGNSVVSGTLWISDCNAKTSKLEADKLALSLQMQGWRWLNRSNSKLGATFDVNEIVRFTVDVAIDGEIDSEYSTVDKILYASYKPSKEVEIDFKVAGNVDVDKDSIWSSVVSGAATMVGQSPESIANQRFDKIGEQRFKQKLDDGVSMAYNMCSGERVVELRQVNTTQLKQKLASNQQDAYKDVALPPTTLLLFGPYKDSKDNIEIVLNQQEDDALDTFFICQEEAVKVANEYMRGSSESPTVPNMFMQKLDAKYKDLPDKNVEPKCPVIALVKAKSSKDSVIDFKFKVQSSFDKTALLDCDAN